MSTQDMPVELVAQLRLLHSQSFLSKIIHYATFPVSKLLEFRVYGPLRSPSWNYIGPIDRIAEATFWPRGDATEISEGTKSREKDPDKNEKKKEKKR